MKVNECTIKESTVFFPGGFSVSPFRFLASSIDGGRFSTQLVDEYVSFIRLYHVPKEIKVKSTESP